MSDFLLPYRLMLLSLLSLLLLPKRKGSLLFTFPLTMSSMVASRFIRRSISKAFPDKSIVALLMRSMTPLTLFKCTVVKSSTVKRLSSLSMRRVQRSLFSESPFYTGGQNTMLNPPSTSFEMLSRTSLARPIRWMPDKSDSLPTWKTLAGCFMIWLVSTPHLLSKADISQPRLGEATPSHFALCFSSSCSY